MIFSFILIFDQNYLGMYTMIYSYQNHAALIKSIVFTKFAIIVQPSIFNHYFRN